VLPASPHNGLSYVKKELSKDVQNQGAKTKGPVSMDGKFVSELLLTGMCMSGGLSLLSICKIVKQPFSHPQLT
jgi:hypothetical protein